MDYDYGGSDDDSSAVPSNDPQLVQWPRRILLVVLMNHLTEQRRVRESILPQQLEFSWSVKLSLKLMQDSL